MVRMTRRSGRVKAVDEVHDLRIAAADAGVERDFSEVGAGGFCVYWRRDMRTPDFTCSSPTRLAMDE